MKIKKNPIFLEMLKISWNVNIELIIVLLSLILFELFVIYH